MAKVDPYGPVQPHMSTPCWLWLGYIQTGGYGQFNLTTAGRVTQAHRASYILFVGPIPKKAKRDVCHICDVHSCVRPDHLILATRRANMQDMVSKGRHHWQVKHAAKAATEATKP
jgi:hypothetical protein